jgi:hypothetical protein
VQVAGLRYYNAGLGRWASRDPIGEEGGTALVAFCRNATTGLVDPVGQSATGSVGEECCCCDESQSCTTETHTPALVVTRYCLMGRRIPGLPPYIPITIPTHCWLAYYVDGARKTVGFYPGGPVDDDSGYDDYRDDYDGLKAKEVRLSPCNYDLKKFTACVEGFGSGKHPSKQYDEKTNNCYIWATGVISVCKSYAARTCH